MGVFEQLSNTCNLTYTNGTHGWICTAKSHEQYQYLNYTFATYFIIISLVSTIFNPIIFCHHYRIRSISAMLFTLLSISDFITNISGPLVVTYNLLKSDIDKPYRPATILEQMYTVYYGTVIYTSNVLVCLLCITRYISIKYAFYHINRKLLVTYIIFYIVFVFIT